MRFFVVLIVLATTSCRKGEFPQQRYEQATAALRHGNLKEARRLATLHPTNDGAWRSKFRLLDAEILLVEGRAKQALPLLSNASSDDYLEARRLMLQGDGLLRLDRYDEASRALDEARKRATALQAFDLMVEVDRLRGLLLTIRNQVPEAARILDTALSQAGQLRDPYLQAAVSITLAVNRMRVFRYDEALAFGMQALRFAEGCGAERLRASALGNLGLCTARLGDFDKAHAYSEQAADLRERLGDPQSLQSGLGALGNIYMLEGDAIRAIPCYQRALAVAKQLGAESYASAWAANLAEALAEARD